MADNPVDFVATYFQPPYTIRIDMTGMGILRCHRPGLVQGKLRGNPGQFHPCDGIDLLMVSKWVLGPLVIGIFISRDIL